MQTPTAKPSPFIDQRPARPLPGLAPPCGRPGRSVNRTTPLPGEAWTCARCGRHLATIAGRTFETPRGIAGQLPGAIRCPRCTKRNTRD